MTEVKTSPVRAQRVDELDDRLDTPGAFEFFYKRGSKEGDEPIGLLYVCPCGCKRQGSLEFKPAPSPSWSWDGNKVAPTLLPSVHHIGHWHGWLIGGVWTSC